MSRLRVGVGSRVLAFLTLCGLVVSMAGCHRPRPAPVVWRYVRFEALWPLHPLWTQMETLQRIGQMGQVAQKQASALSPNSLQQLPLFAAPEAIPEGFERERRARIAQDARKRINRMTIDLREHNNDVLEREQRAWQKELDARIIDAQVAFDAKLPRILSDVARPYNRQVDRLGFKEVDYLNQTHTFTGEALADSQTQLGEVRAQEDALRKERDAKVAEARAKAENDFQAVKATWTRQLQERIAKRQQELETLAANQIAQEEESLRNQARPIPALGSSVPVETQMPPFALEPPNGPTARAQMQAAQNQVSAALARRSAQMETERQHILAMIQNDTRTAVTQIAHARGWKFAPEGVQRGIDMTQEAAGELRAQWGHH